MLKKLELSEKQTIVEGIIKIIDKIDCEDSDLTIFYAGKRRCGEVITDIDLDTGKQWIASEHNEFVNNETVTVLFSEPLMIALHNGNNPSFRTDMEELLRPYRLIFHFNHAWSFTLVFMDTINIEKLNLVSTFQTERLNTIIKILTKHKKEEALAAIDCGDYAKASILLQAFNKELQSIDEKNGTSYPYNISSQSNMALYEFSSFLSDLATEIEDRVIDALNLADKDFRIQIHRPYLVQLTLPIGDKRFVNTNDLLSKIDTTTTISWETVYKMKSEKSTLN